MSSVVYFLGAYAVACLLFYLARWFDGEARKARGYRAKLLVYPPRRPDVWRRYDDPTFLLRSDPVIARPRKLKVQWDERAVADLRTMWGIDTEVEIVKEMLMEIEREGDREVARYLRCKPIVDGVIAQVFGRKTGEDKR